MSASPCLTVCPSVKLILMIWPSTRLRTVTVLKAVTLPSPLKKTGRSPFCAVETTTGMEKFAGRPVPPPLPAAAGAPLGPAEAELACEPWPRKYQIPAPTRTRRTTQIQLRLRREACAVTDAGLEDARLSSRSTESKEAIL